MPRETTKTLYGACGDLDESPLDSARGEHLDVNSMALRLRALRTEPLDARKSLFKALCLSCHPDKNLDHPEKAREVFQYLQEKKGWFLGSMLWA